MSMFLWATVALAGAPLRPDLVEGRSLHDEHCAACHAEPVPSVDDGLADWLGAHEGVELPPGTARWNLAWYLRTIDRPVGHVEVARALLQESFQAYAARDQDDARALTERLHRDGVRPLLPLLAVRPDLQQQLDADARTYRANLASGSEVGLSMGSVRRLTQTLDEVEELLADGGPPATELMTRIATTGGSVAAAGALALGAFAGPRRHARAVGSGIAAGVLLGGLWSVLAPALALADQLPWGGWFMAVSQLVATLLWVGATAAGPPQRKWSERALMLAPLPWVAPIASAWLDLLWLWLGLPGIVAGGLLGAAALSALPALLGAGLARLGTAGIALAPILAAVAAGRLILALQTGGWLGRTAVYGPELPAAALHRTAEGYGAQVLALALFSALAWLAARRRWSQWEE